LGSFAKETYNFICVALRPASERDTHKKERHTTLLCVRERAGGRARESGREGERKRVRAHSSTHLRKRQTKSQWVYVCVCEREREGERAIQIASERGERECVRAHDTHTRAKKRDEEMLCV